ncbi:hypothetical protein WME79_19960 [Sorangium sp. So ce726]|uniref:hypothetical protein n=1 Tax=Sorangium sp. So ce726 TaxID=3133319 RepID=UPI003F5F2BA1
MRRVGHVVDPPRVPSGAMVHEGRPVSLGVSAQRVKPEEAAMRDVKELEAQG